MDNILLLSAQLHADTKHDVIRCRNKKMAHDPLGIKAAFGRLNKNATASIHHHVS